MLSKVLKNLSILKKFLFINLIVFIILGTFTTIYLKNVQPSLIKKKTANHIELINNTLNHIKRLKIKFNKEDIRKFLFSTRFLFQNLDRVILYDKNFNLLGDTDTLDLDARSFSSKLDIIEFDILEKKNFKKKLKKDTLGKNILLNDILLNYSTSKNLGTHYTFTRESYNQFLLTTIKDVNIKSNNIGFLVIVENANEIRAAINERKNFIIRTALVVALVIFIFSIVLNRYFLKPIKNLVDYTNIIKEKSKKKTNIEALKNRNDELGILSISLDDMTHDLQKRINNAENFSTDLVHEIRNPLTSLKSASEILTETEDKSQRMKLISILINDVERIERLITDYSQMLKDEVALSKEKMKKIDLKSIIKSVVEEFNSIYENTKGIQINLTDDQEVEEYIILGIENRIEQIIANLLDNSISFSSKNQKISVEVKRKSNSKIIIKVIDQGEGFNEKNMNKVFNRFYSNRPDSFGEHSGLGLNIVKNLVDLHGGSISVSNNPNQRGANVEIIFPSA